MKTQNLPNLLRKTGISGVVLLIIASAFLAYIILPIRASSALSIQTLAINPDSINPFGAFQKGRASCDDGLGNLYAVYENDNATGRQLLLKENSGPGWSAPKLVVAGTGPDWSISCHGSGLFLAYTLGGTTGESAAYWLEGTISGGSVSWASPIPMVSFAWYESVDTPSIAWTSNGIPVVAFWGIEQGVNSYRTFAVVGNDAAGSSWGQPQVLVLNATWSGAQPGVLAFRTGASVTVLTFGLQQQIWASRFDGSSWSAPSPVSLPVAGNDDYHSAVTDGSGTAHIIFYGEGTLAGGLGYLTTADGVNWSTPIIIPGSAGGSFPCLSIDQSDNLYAFSGSPTTMVEMYHNGTWAAPVALSQAIIGATGNLNAETSCLELVHSKVLLLWTGLDSSSTTSSDLYSGTMNIGATGGSTTTVTVTKTVTITSTVTVTASTSTSATSTSTSTTTTSSGPASPVQSVTFSGCASPCTVSLPSAPTAGNVLVLGFGCSCTLGGITSGWTAVGTGGEANGYLADVYAIASSSSSGSVTITSNGATAGFLVEVKNITLSGAVYSTANEAGTPGTSFSTPSITAPFVISVVKFNVGSDSITPGTGFTLISTTNLQDNNGAVNGQYAVGLSATTSPMSASPSSTYWVQTTVGFQ